MARQNDFDRLHVWAKLTDVELEKLIDADSIATMQRVMVLLGAFYVFTPVWGALGRADLPRSTPRTGRTPW